MKLRFALSAVVALAAFLLGAAYCRGQAQTGRSGPWQWPPIPGCLADPGIKTEGTTDFSSPVCALYERLLGSGVTDIELRSARRVNGEMDGVLYPAFLPGTEVVQFTVAGDFDQSFHGSTGLVRVSTRAITARSGSWWTAVSAVSDDGHLLSAGEIRSKLALTYTPSCIAYAERVRKGVRAYMGAVAPAFDERGGGIEFWFPPNSVVAGRVEDIPGGGSCPP